MSFTSSSSPTITTCPARQAVGLLELALERAPGLLHVRAARPRRAAPAPAWKASRRELGLGHRDEHARVDVGARSAPARAGSARRPPPSPRRAWAARPAARRARRSARRRPAPRWAPRRRSRTRTPCACSSPGRARAWGRPRSPAPASSSSARTSAKCSASSRSSRSSSCGAVGHHPPGALVVGVERAQRVQVEPRPHLLGELALAPAKVVAQLLDVGRARLRRCRGSRAAAARPAPGVTQQLGQQQDQLGVERRVVGAERLGADLGELAEAAGLRRLVAEERAPVPELHRLRRACACRARRRRGRSPPCPPGAASASARPCPRR